MPTTVAAYRAQHVFSAVEHFPGLGATDQSTEEGPATVGLDLDELRARDLIPFEAAIDAGVPAVVICHALYPINDFTVPASLSRSIATGLLRRELGFTGVAITDDLADPAITSSYSVPDAAVQALRAGADMLYISGPAGDQQAAYVAVLRRAVGQALRGPDPRGGHGRSRRSRTTGSSSERLHLHPVVVEGRRVARARSARCDVVACAAAPVGVVARSTSPSAPRARRARASSETRAAQRERAAVVEDPHLGAVAIAARAPRRRGAATTLGLGLRRVLALLVGERRVEEQVRLRRDQREREALGQPGVGHLGGRRVVARAAPAGRRGAEAALGVRRRALAEIDLRASRARAGRPASKPPAQQRLDQLARRSRESRGRRGPAARRSAGRSRCSASPRRRGSIAGSFRSGSGGPRRRPRRGARAGWSRAARRRRARRCRS